MSDLAVRLEDISDDEQPSTDAPTDTDPLAISGGAAYSNLGKEIITLNTDMPCSTSVENNSEQSWKSIEMCTFMCFNEVCQDTTEKHFYFYTQQSSLQKRVITSWASFCVCNN